MLPEHLDPALRPADPLPPQPLEGFGDKDPAQGPGLVTDVPELALELPGDVDVLGDGVAVEEAALHDGALAVGGDHAGNGENLPEDALGALDKPDDVGVFADLDLREERRAVAHAGVARDGPHAGEVHQVMRHPLQHVLVDEAIGVDREDELAPAHQDGRIEGLGLAAVGLQVDDAQPVRVPRHEPVQDLPRGVGAAVVDDDDLVARVVQILEVEDRLLDDLLLVVTGDDDGEERADLELRLRPALAAQAEDGAPDHPHDTHVERVEEDKESDDLVYRHILYRRGGRADRPPSWRLHATGYGLGLNSFLNSLSTAPSGAISGGSSRRFTSSFAERIEATVSASGLLRYTLSG